MHNRISNAFNKPRKNPFRSEGYEIPEKVIETKLSRIESVYRENVTFSPELSFYEAATADADDEEKVREDRRGGGGVLSSEGRKMENHSYRKVNNNNHNNSLLLSEESFVSVRLGGRAPLFIGLRT